MKLETGNVLVRRSLGAAGKFGIVIVALFAALSAQAVEFVQTEAFVSSEGEILREEIWVSAQTITIDGEMTDDLMATGTLLDLRGRFQGDVWGCGDTINANGLFGDNVRIIARSAKISGTLDGSLVSLWPTSLFDNTIKIERSAVIKKNMLFHGGNIISEGDIVGNVLILAKNATLGGQIDGDVSVVAQNIVVLPGTVINGNLTYTAPNELILSPSVTLIGELKRNALPIPKIFKPNLIGHFMFGIAALVTGLVFVGLFPRYAGGTLHALRTSRGLSMLIGFAALVMLPATAFLLLFTVVGLPLSMLVFLFYLILLYLSKIVVALALGSALLRRKEFSKKKAAGSLALGLFIIYALTSFVAASMLINILIIILGLGALLLALFKKPVLVIQPSDVINQSK